MTVSGPTVVTRVLAIVLAIAAVRCGTPPRYLVLATTTSVANSGLLTPLVQAYEQDHGVAVRHHLVGSGLALRMLDAGDADVVISHAPATEREFLASHPTWTYRKVMFNDFVLVGPPDDPAGARGQPIEEAMRRVAGADVVFISRGDASGTHEREQQLWALAGVAPTAPRLVVAGSGMGVTLRIASERGAYTLTDRATLAQLAPDVTLTVVSEGGAALLNTYAVVWDASSRAGPAAARFGEWLSAGRGRDVIADYRIGETAVFTPWPAGVVADVPKAQPH